VTDGKVVEGFAHDKENFAILNGLKHLLMPRRLTQQKSIANHSLALAA